MDLEILAAILPVLAVAHTHATKFIVRLAGSCGTAPDPLRHLSARVTTLVSNSLVDAQR